MTTFHLVQSEIHWEDGERNRADLQSSIGSISGGVIVLPEMFTTGFSMASRRLAETMSGETVAWMKHRADQQHASVCGSVIITDNGHFYNRFIWIDPGGAPIIYDKRHLFRMADEHDHYSPGGNRPVIQAGDVRVLPQVCYDLRFPAWSRNRANEYDVLLYIANWPAARRDQWLALLKARAIENLCYVVAVNRTGTDGNTVAYSGDSCVIDYRGEMTENLGDTNEIRSVDIDMISLADYRDAFPAHLDSDEFTIR